MKTTKTKKAAFTFKSFSTFYACLIVLLVTLTIFNVSLFFFKRTEVSYVVKNPLEKQIAFWQNFLDIHPTYFEGWIELAKLKMKAGDTQNAQVAFSKAWKINPNSEEIVSLKMELEN